MIPSENNGVPGRTGTDELELAAPVALFLNALLMVVNADPKEVAVLLASRKRRGSDMSQAVRTVDCCVVQDSLAIVLVWKDAFVTIECEG